MQQIQFVATSPQELKKEIIVDVKVILDDFLKNFKPKKPKRSLPRREKEKLAKAILLIFQITILLIHLIEPSLLQNNHFIIIIFLFHVVLAIIKTKQNF
ncbi:hypothetical protein [Flavobacterium urumqiense]|uniref:Uncharacterized protein n=1 Tax=Flavobacterium urumqiense TaxID=935224 RepID=A0A1H5SHD2_9FLAO|nr:hypothetical protein [Flavobacterium urumqiense]SEF49860.1 hypothetical protein SAMN04488130_101283 [Flavobacterium urumqiense]